MTLETDPLKTLTNIPLIDFSPFLTDDSEGQQYTAQSIFQACHEVGFLYLKNHGVPQIAIDKVFEQSHVFFALPFPAKQKIAWSSEQSNRGYIGIERECLDETQPGDLKEAFNVGREPDPNHPFSDANRWPDNQRRFRQTVTEFFEQCSIATERIFRAFAYALSLTPDYLTTCHQTHDYTLRLLHYPPLSAPSMPGQLRAGAHSDYGSLTLLFQDNVGGLEVLNAEGKWITAPTIPGTIVINTGDLMQRWSNDIFRSTQHRVKLPSGENSQRHRYSIAFFCQPDADTDIICLPSCQSLSNPPKYPPVKSRDYLLSRLRATY